MSESTKHHPSYYTERAQSLFHVSFTYRTSLDSRWDGDTLNVVAADVEQAVKFVRAALISQYVQITEVKFLNHVHLPHKE